ncbi:hypothetical protein [Accumulibacter sp.]|uniref:hypothetical protein n=1 Tax=Accumulibacter sp. TaxID=2053492 RepID=UPI0026031A21|nr:hypothetical protein [Accumulibacter sp.]
MRELSTSVTPLATLADAGRINETDFDEEISRLRLAWCDAPDGDAAQQIPGDDADRLCKQSA